VYLQISYQIDKHCQLDSQTGLSKRSPKDGLDSVEKAAIAV
jgi:hypothetical protein